MKAIIGKKVGMSQIFDENGHVIPVTVIEAGPCVVVQKKTSEKEGYKAVQLGYEDIPERKLSKPEMGHLKKADVSPKKYLREFNLENADALNVGDLVKADTFAVALDNALVPRPCGRHRPLQNFQGQDRRRPHGRGTGYCPEPVCCEG